MRIATLALLALVLASAAEARAQAPAGGLTSKDAAAAQALYDAAGDLMDEKKWDEARTKLEEALRIAPGAVGAKLRLAECLEGQGRLASAWTMYLAAESAAKAAGQTERANRARAAASSLEPRLSRLTVSVPQGTRDLPGLAIERDTTPVGPGQWGVAIPVDGGAHKVVALASGKARWEKEVTLADEGASVTIDVEGLLDRPSPVVIPVVLPKVVGPPTVPSAPLPEAPPRRQIPTWSFVAGASGLALGAVGVAFAFDLKSVVDRQIGLCGPSIDHCERASPPYDPAADNDRKVRDYALGLAFGGAGTALLAAGILGIVLAPVRSSPAPKSPGTLGPSPGAAPRGGTLRLSPGVWASEGGGGAVVVGEMQ